MWLALLRELFFLQSFSKGLTFLNYLPVNFVDENYLSLKSDHPSSDIHFSCFISNYLCRRVSGDADLSQKLKCELNTYPASNPPEFENLWANYEVHVLAGLLKQWLRQMDEPLIPLHFYNQFISHVSANDVTSLLALTNRIGQHNRTVLKYLIAFLQVSQIPLQI